MWRAAPINTPHPWPRHRPWHLVKTHTKATTTRTNLGQKTRTRHRPRRGTSAKTQTAGPQTAGPNSAKTQKGGTQTPYICAGTGRAAEGLTHDLARTCAGKKRSGYLTWRAKTQASQDTDLGGEIRGVCVVCAIQVVGWINTIHRLEEQLQREPQCEHSC